MEKVIKDSYKKRKNLEKLKIKIFSKTLNKNHNLKKKDFYLLQLQPYITKKNTKEKLNLKEECLTNKLIENIESYFDINQTKIELLNIINENDNNIHIYPNYICLEKYVFEKMMEYIPNKRNIDYKLSIINKIRKEKLKNNKTRRSYIYQEVNNEFMNTMFDEGLKILKKKITKYQRIKRKIKEKKSFNLLKSDKHKNNNNYQDLMEKRENIILINELKQSIDKVNSYNYKLKLKSINLLYIIINKVLKRLIRKAYRQFITKLIFIKNIYHNLRNKSSFKRTMMIPIIQKKNKAKTNRYSMVERKSIVMNIFNKFNRETVYSKHKYKFKPVYLFNKNYNEENNIFNKFFKDWNSNKDKKIIDDIYKYTEENFNINHNILYSQINKLIKNNKLDTLTKEVSKNKNKSEIKRFNTISNVSKNNKNKLLKQKNNNKDAYGIKEKLLLNLKYQL